MQRLKSQLNTPQESLHRASTQDSLIATITARNGVTEGTLSNRAFYFFLIEFATTKRSVALSLPLGSGSRLLAMSNWSMWRAPEQRVPKHPYAQKTVFSSVPSTSLFESSAMRRSLSASTEYLTVFSKYELCNVFDLFAFASSLDS